MTKQVEDRPVFAAERHERILQLLAEQGRVRTIDLADALSVAEPTIRKDIIDLNGRGLLRRTYGGAIAVSATTIEPTIATRSTRHVDAKRRIAAQAVSMIEPGESVYLDNGTTVLALATALSEAPVATRPAYVNVLTNGVGVAQAVADLPGVRHVLLGGTYRAAGNALTGPLTLDSLERFSISTAFIGVSGFSANSFTVGDVTEAQVKAAVIAKSTRVVVLMDSSKFGVSDFARVCDVNAITAIVTDHADDDVAEQIRAAGVELITS